MIFHKRWAKSRRQSPDYLAEHRYYSGWFLFGFIPVYISVTPWQHVQITYK